MERAGFSGYSNVTVLGWTLLRRTSCPEQKRYLTMWSELDGCFVWILDGSDVLSWKNDIEWLVRIEGVLDGYSSELFCSWFWFCFLLELRTIFAWYSRSVCRRPSRKKNPNSNDLSGSDKEFADGVFEDEVLNIERIGPALIFLNLLTNSGRRFWVPQIGSILMAR